MSFSSGFSALTLNEARAVVESFDRNRLTRGQECPRADCTGVHSHTGPRADWCPRTRDLDRQWDSFGRRATYKYLWSLDQRIETKTGLMADLMADLADVAGVEAVTKAVGALPEYAPKPLPSGSRRAHEASMRALLARLEAEAEGRA